MYSYDPEYTNPALEVIRQADPQVYQQMTQSPWRVYPIRPGGGLPMQIYRDFSEDQADFFFSVAAGATPTGTNRTYLNTAIIGMIREEEKIPSSHAIASTMVHEFQHTVTGGSADEHGAFEAQRAFNAKMGDHIKAANASAEAYEVRNYGNNGYR